MSRLDRRSLGRQWLGRKAGVLIPGLDDRVFNRDRNRSVPGSRAPRGGYPRRPFEDRSAQVLVVPPEGPQFPDWGPGNRNFYFEAWQSARELFGETCVHVLDVGSGETPARWHRALVDTVGDLSITHVLTHIEHDPGSPDRWTWDEAWNPLAREWDGVLLGVMFDSAYDLVMMKTRRLARMSPQFLAVDICTSIDGQLVRGRPEVGPVTMPVSQLSLELLHRTLHGVVAKHDVSFIGALYPYRVELIETLRALGIDVAVNPHRADVTRDFTESRTNQPNWLAYMTGLAESRMTINFSRSSAGDFEQLKTRVIEATLAGTFLLTDDRSSTRRFFEPESEYGYFADIGDLPRVIEDWLDQEQLRERGRIRAQEKAQVIAHDDFWRGIARGVEDRGLPAIPAEVTSSA